MTIAHSEFFGNVARSNIATGSVAVLEKSGLVASLCSFWNNTVIGFGACYASPVDDLPRCPAAFGAGITVAVGSSAVCTACDVSRNSASCSGGDLGSECTAQGGGIAVARNGIGAVQFHNITCQENTVHFFGQI